MKIDIRILNKLTETCGDNDEFVDDFVSILEEVGEGASYHLAHFNSPAYGFCDAPDKKVYISDALMGDTPNNMFLLFVLLHETKHLSHDWKHACSLEYDDFKKYVNNMEDEANDFALAHLISLKSKGFTDEINELIKAVESQRKLQEAQFDRTYGAVYHTIGADLNFDKHIGHLID